MTIHPSHHMITGNDGTVLAGLKYCASCGWVDAAGYSLTKSKLAEPCASAAAQSRRGQSGEENEEEMPSA